MDVFKESKMDDALNYIEHLIEGERYAQAEVLLNYVAQWEMLDHQMERWKDLRSEIT